MIYLRSSITLCKSFYTNTIKAAEYRPEFSGEARPHLVVSLSQPWFNSRETARNRTYMTHIIVFTQTMNISHRFNELDHLCLLVYLTYTFVYPRPKKTRTHTPYRERDREGKEEYELHP